MNMLLRAVEPLLDLIFPPTCGGCGAEGTFLCNDCEADIPALDRMRCRVCSKPGTSLLCGWCRATDHPFDGITAPYRWDGIVRDLVYSLKYKGVRASAPRLSELMIAHLRRRSLSVDVIVPVPLHSRRERQRGYNHSALLAEGIGRGMGIPVAVDMLTRTRNTPPQVSMRTPEERHKNVVDAFECADDPDGRRVLLVDDVVTTGATIAACSAPLREAGASSIWALSLAR